ncbi:MAG: radical SAM family heme chaperone HemW, partial [Calditrichota bacterium]
MQKTESTTLPAFDLAMTRPAYFKQNGLYVHIPFCIRKCEYCDFYSITQFDQVDAFVDALQLEMQLAAPARNDITFTTVFFGGGTPSLLSEEQLSAIWQTMNSCFHISSNAQITIEANPGDLGYTKLDFLRKLGFNRLSMGVQSFVESELKFLGRIHSPEDVEENIGFARKAGFNSLNIDLMTSFPGITPESFQYSLNKALSFGTEHLSCYTLIFEPGTILYKRMKKGEVRPLENEQEAEYYEMARETLEAQGYGQYEISNF